MTEFQAQRLCDQLGAEFGVVINCVLSNGYFLFSAQVSDPYWGRWPIMFYESHEAPFVEHHMKILLLDLTVERF